MAQLVGRTAKSEKMFKQIGLMGIAIACEVKKNDNLKSKAQPF